ncbi:MAG: hypothetical protein IJ141_00740 [Lachnospiraceae bacterium]|nr:hypothetical protein [Lachnospiraceae bacterium]
MRAIIKENIISTQYLITNAKGFLNPIAVLRDVKILYKTDTNGSRTDEVIGIKYECIDTETFSTFSVKVEGNVKPVITAQELELSTTPVYIEIPVEQTLIRPYDISFGNAKISIVAKNVKLHKEG